MVGALVPRSREPGLPLCDAQPGQQCQGDGRSGADGDRVSLHEALQPVPPARGACDDRLARQVAHDVLLERLGGRIAVARRLAQGLHHDGIEVAAQRLAKRRAGVARPAQSAGENLGFHFGRRDFAYGLRERPDMTLAVARTIRAMAVELVGRFGDDLRTDSPGAVAMCIDAADLDMDALIGSFGEVPDVCEVHDLHVWTLTAGFGALAAHVVVTEGSDRDLAQRRLEVLLKQRFGIDHTTLQMEEQAGEDLLRVERAPEPS